MKIYVVTILVLLLSLSTEAAPPVKIDFSQSKFVKGIIGVVETEKKVACEIQDSESTISEDGVYTSVFYCKSSDQPKGYGSFGDYVITLTITGNVYPER